MSDDLVKKSEKKKKIEIRLACPDLCDHDDTSAQHSLSPLKNSENYGSKGVK